MIRNDTRAPTVYMYAKMQLAQENYRIALRKAVCASMAKLLGPPDMKNLLFAVRLMRLLKG